MAGEAVLCVSREGYMKSFVGEPIGGRIFLNPGTGPVEDANEENARINTDILMAEIGLPSTRARRYRRNDYGEGRYCFRLYRAGFVCEVQMPGLPLDQVRFTGENGQGAWDYPRLYVDGGSWLWKFAIGCARRALSEETDEDE